MAFTLKELLALDEFKDYKIVGGIAGIDKEVRTVNVMDAPDIDEWIRGGEIVLTTGFLFKNNLDLLADLIEKVNNAGATALFIKEKRFIEEIPKCVIEQANKLGFPVISMPFKDAFIDVINPVLSKLIVEQTKIIQHHEKIHRVFTDLAISGGDIEKIIEALSEMINKSVAFYDVFFDKVYSYPEEYDKEEFLKNYETEYPHFNLYIDKKIYGYIVIKDKEYEALNFDLIAIENAITVIQLSIQKGISNMQIEKKYRDQFVQDIIFNNIKSLMEIEYRGKIYGFRTNKNYRVILFNIDNFKMKFIKKENQNYEINEISDIVSDIFKFIKDIMKSKFSQIMYTQFTDTMVFIVEEEFLSEKVHQHSYKVVNEIREKVKNKFKYTTTVGIGRVKDSIMNVSASYKEAQQAVKLAGKIYGNNITIDYDDMGVYKVLAKVVDEKEVIQFYKEKLGKLLGYEKNNRFELLDTLEAIIDNNWNLKTTAEREFIHYNTIKYRYHKIEEILGVKFESVSEKVNIELAVKIYRMRKLTDNYV